MARVIITKSLVEKINKKFKKESIKIFKLMYSLERFPKKGKVLGSVGEIVIKEIKYKSYRFYFIVDGNKLKILDLENLNNILIKFIRMSNKKSQQKTIDEIKSILKSLGKKGF